MTALAASLYLGPVLCLLVARAGRARPLWQLALDIPFAVAADVLFVLLCARVVPLETAALASRPIAVATAGAWLWWRRRRGEPCSWPRALTVRALWIALAVATVAVLASLALSRTYHIWDRFWHVSLVSSLRVQRLPFANVYEPGHALAYHYAGDGIAAMLQTFSFGTLHASHALSLAHDLIFGLTGATLGLVLAGFGVRGALAAALGTACVLWAGPAALLRTDGKQFSGYSFVNFFTLSFRPHVVLGGLLLVGFVVALLARLRHRPHPHGEPDELGAGAIPLGRTALPLTVLTATLAITDESSVALLGLALGAAWLVDPEVLAPERLGPAAGRPWLARRLGGLGRALARLRDTGLVRRRGAGVLVLLGLLVAVVGANLLYAGLLSPGAARPGVRLVPWRSPGFGTPFPPVPWSAPGGLGYFVADTAGLLLLAAAAVWVALRGRSRAVWASAAFVLALVALGLFGLARLDLDPRHSESHRFMTAPMLAAPLVGLAWLRWRTTPHAPGRSPFAMALVVLGLALPTVSTLAWVCSPGETKFQTQASFGTSEDFYATDCVTELGGGLGLAAEPLYVSQRVFYLYTGCRPTFMPGSDRGRHKIKTSTPLHGKAALAELDRDMVAPGADLGAICESSSSDPICAQARKEAPCTPIGTTRRGVGIERCTLDAALRARLLGTGTRTRAPETAAQPSAAPSATEPDDG
ncbi:MAG: hypothetical protein IT373_25675 [Polyangiaceae bacterium]|nr:hypothetical protein [Polyangiaceae bacterium]